MPHQSPCEVEGRHLSTQVQVHYGKTWAGTITSQQTLHRKRRLHLMASLWWPPTFRCPRSCNHRQTNLLVLGQQLHSKGFIRLTGFFTTSRCWTPLNQQGFETWNFHQKTFEILWNLRSSVIHQSVHIARPTFSTTSLWRMLPRHHLASNTSKEVVAFVALLLEITWDEERKKIRNIFKIKLGLFCVHKLSSAARLVLDSG